MLLKKKSDMITIGVLRVFTFNIILIFLGLCSPYCYLSHLFFVYFCIFLPSFVLFNFQYFFPLLAHQPVLFIYLFFWLLLSLKWIPLLQIILLYFTHNKSILKQYTYDFFHHQLCNCCHLFYFYIVIISQYIIFIVLVNYIFKT